MDYKPIDDELVGNVYFTVQVGAFKSDTIPDDLAYLFMDLDSIKEINDNQWTYLTVGEFDNINEARFYLELVKDVGVKDAFVTAFNYNRKVEIRQAEAYLEEQEKLRIEQQEKTSNSKKKKRKFLFSKFRTNILNFIFLSIVFLSLLIALISL